MSKKPQRDANGRIMKGSSPYELGLTELQASFRKAVLAYAADNNVPDMIISSLVEMAENKKLAPAQRLKAIQQLSDLIGIKTVSYVNAEEKQASSTLASMLQTAFEEKTAKINELEAQAKMSKLKASSSKLAEDD